MVKIKDMKNAIVKQTGTVYCTNIKNTCSSKEGGRCKMTCASCVFQFSARLQSGYNNKHN